MKSGSKVGKSDPGMTMDMTRSHDHPVEGIWRGIHNKAGGIGQSVKYLFL